MADFNADRHRFRFEYEGKEYVVPCYGSLDVIFDDETVRSVPVEVCENIKKLIWDKINKEESSWLLPEEAYDVANAYCAAEFS